jgi:hypothetical protein
MMAISTAQLTTSIKSHIQHALFGRPGPVQHAGCSLDDVHQMSQDFALMAPIGGGAMLAFQALGHQPCRLRRDRRQ